MPNIKVSKNIIPVSEFKAHAAKWLRHINETGEPLVLTQNGKAAAVLVAPESYDDANDRDRFVAAVREGLADADAGRTHPHDEVAAEFDALIKHWEAQ